MPAIKTWNGFSQENSGWLETDYEVAAENAKPAVASANEQNRQYGVLNQERNRLLNLLGIGNGGTFFQDFGLGSQGGGDFQQILQSLLGSASGATARLNQGAQDAQGSSLAMLEDRGFGSSNLVPVAGMAIEGQRQSGLSGIKSGVLDEVAGATTRNAGRQSQSLNNLAGILGALLK